MVFGKMQSLEIVFGLGLPEMLQNLSFLLLCVRTAACISSKRSFYDLSSDVFMAS